MSCKFAANHYDSSLNDLREFMKGPKIKEMNAQEIDSLIERVEQACSLGLTLSTEDLTLLLETFKVCLRMQEQLSANDLTMHKLRKLLGMINSSEKRPTKDESNDNGSKGTEANDKKPEKTTKGHGPRGKNDFPNASKAYHNDMQGLNKGDACPDCTQGKVYSYEPSILVRISAHPPYEATIHIRSRLRCNRCTRFFSAALPNEVLADGGEKQRFGHSACAMMALQKYSQGMPFKRQEDLQKTLGLKITASTIFDQCEKVADVGFFIQKELTGMARDAESLNIDDTSHRIRNKEPVKSSRTGKQKTAVNTSVLIADLENNRQAILFKTNVGHAGDFIDDVLLERSPHLPAPLLMSDALASNRPTSCVVRHSLCNAHARREFFDLYSDDKEAVDKILDFYARVFANDQHIKESGMDAVRRLEYHQQHSLPLMRELREYAKSLISSQKYEENSNMGKAVAYFDNHWFGLTGFCRWEGAKLDNNHVERAIKAVVLGRKNYYFYHTTAGAAVSDVIKTLIATCKVNEINPYHYLTALLANAAKVREVPSNWLPWNYVTQGLGSVVAA